MPRTIVRTTIAGWYINADNPDGPRVRKQPDDHVITQEEYKATKNGQTERRPTQQRAAVAAQGAHEAKAARGKEKPKRERGDNHVSSVVSDTGKVLHGKTTTIKCHHKDEETGQVCGRERTIKVQDAFQVKYCVEHQQAHRRKVKREKLRAKRRRDKAQKAAAK